MEINGVYYTEPDLASKLRQMQEVIDHLFTENDLLVDKVIEGDKREREFKRLLKAAVEYIKKALPEVGTCDGCAKYDEENCKCKGNPLKCRDECEWEHEAEVLELIGEIND